MTEYCEDCRGTCRCGPPLFPIQYDERYGTFESNGRVLFVLSAHVWVNKKERTQLSKIILEKLNSE
jgi:hypothetical protein